MTCTHTHVRAISFLRIFVLFLIAFYINYFLLEKFCSFNVTYDQLIKYSEINECANRCYYELMLTNLICII